MVSLEQDIIKAPGPTLARIAQFLDLDWTEAPAASPAAVFPGSRRRPDGHGGVSFAAPAHHADQLLPAQGVSADQLRTLREHYRADVERLGALLQRDFLVPWGFQAA